MFKSPNVIYNQIRGADLPSVKKQKTKLTPLCQVSSQICREGLRCPIVFVVKYLQENLFWKEDPVQS